MALPISFRLLSRRELRFATRGALGVGAVGLLVAAFWLSPWSPGALEHAAQLAAMGDTDQAIDVYLDVANGPAFAGTQRDARWSAAWLASVDDGDPQRALLLLRDYATRYPADPHAAQAWERLATLYRLHMHDPVRAAQAWDHAAAVSLSSPDAHRWKLEAGLAWIDAEQPERALVSLRAAAINPAQAPAAWLAMGRLQLSQDPAAAYDAYSKALTTSACEADASLARLGVATALESLDKVDQALAELDAGDRQDPALQRRRARLQAHERK